MTYTLIFKGIMKSGDFNGYAMRLVNWFKLIEESREIVLFMNNASIDKNWNLREETVVQIAILYNALYSP